MSRLDKLMKMLAAEPNDPFVLYGIAQEHANAEEYDQALAFYDKCLSADSNYLYAYYHKAVVQRDAGNAAGSTATLKEGIKRAQRAGDAKAASEMQTLMDTLD